MIFARIYITLKKGILDPQGKAVHHALQTLGFEQVKDVRVGKLIELKFEGVDLKKAEQLVVDACKKLLANPVIEDYTFELSEVGREKESVLKK